MEHSHNVYFPVFEYSISIVCTDDVNKSRKVRGHIIGATSEDFNNVEGLHSSSGKDAFVFLLPKVKAGTVAHECSHAIRRMFEYIGADFANELFEYHLDYLVDKATDFLKIVEKKKKRNAHH